jgi:hypothetical protein
MYEELDTFEKALSHFGTRVDVICAMEMGGKLDAETAYKNIKLELKELKRVRKSFRKKENLQQVQGDKTSK